MINESAVNKHFKKMWKKGQIFVEDSSPGYLISDVNLILRVPEGLRLFDDRALFPELPPENKCYTYGKLYSKLHGFLKVGPEIEELIKNFLKEDLAEIQATPWRYEDAVLMHNNEKYLFVNQQFLNLLAGNYTGYNNIERKDSPVIYGDSKDIKKVFAVIMPMRIDFTREDCSKFPNIPELIEETKG